MNDNKTAVIVYVVISLLTIGVLIFFLVRCEKKNCDGYCICSHGSGLRDHICQPNMKPAYRKGLTEFTDFAQVQKNHGGPKWSTVSPGDYDYPAFDSTCANEPN